MKNILSDFKYPKKGFINYALLNSGGGIATLYIFKEGGELKTHKANSDVLVIIQEGIAHVTVEGESFVAPQGTTILFAKGQLHSLKAEKSFKTLLIK